MLYSTTFRKTIKKKEKATVAVLRASILDREIHLFVFIPHKVTSIKKKNLLMKKKMVTTLKNLLVRHIHIEVSMFYSNLGNILIKK